MKILASDNQLTPDERALLRNFRATDERGRQTILWTAAHQAEDWPGKPRPKLRVVGTVTAVPK